MKKCLKERGGCIVFSSDQEKQLGSQYVKNINFSVMSV
jgi:hypothetical protein